MKWKKFKITTTTEAEDIIISDLYDIGLEGAQIEDNIPMTALEKEQMFVDILPKMEEDDGKAVLSFFVEENEDGTLNFRGETVETDYIIDIVKKQLETTSSYMNIGDGKIEIDETEDIDWINNWKTFFHQFTVDDLLIIPSWEDVEPKDKDKKVLHIDPGTAFGTGMHETTQLCIKQLKKYVNKDTEILDVGTGSGILSIVSLMYGANHAETTDLDPCAVAAVEDNMLQNSISSEKLNLTIGNIITDKEIQDKIGYEKYDIVVANILAEVLVPLTPVVYNTMKKGSYYITSGIIDTALEKVLEAVKKNGLEVVEVTEMGEWRSITAKK